MIDSLKHLNWRYAVKKFDATKQLSENKLTILKEAFNLTATSYGLQPIKMLVIKDQDLKNKLVKSSYGQQQVADASHILVLCVETVIDEAYINMYFNLVKKLRNTPETITDPFKNSLIKSFSEKDKASVIKWATNQAYLALGNLLTICAVEEIDACPMEGFIASEYNETLNLKEKGLEAVLVLPVGYRASDDLFATLAKVRKPIEDSIIEL
ncbi:NAD(P)H-dependent oxidoreductase [Cellulophaga baltica]|uniref:NAD(P)H-dependent oxidoreductase n=1 Tax=Cellulophaga TaxID=104264 RepID=UPI001C06EA25|nr:MULTISPECIES: NAD(P)H-dependent oxidoreductase [Cellulophaga]MBU2997552.1 NAD(P)H-dependent oxidoreductase [Cellulophaga baltica]MDO6768947.1 NAD(P)H-dependent oxidoreductase [Cellulophaga sp. 1_MG-2023]